jgi:hypothetical protein
VNIELRDRCGQTGEESKVTGLGRLRQEDHDFNLDCTTCLKKTGPGRDPSSRAPSSKLEALSSNPSTAKKKKKKKSQSTLSVIYNKVL